MENPYTPRLAWASTAAFLLLFWSTVATAAGFPMSALGGIAGVSLVIVGACLGQWLAARQPHWRDVGMISRTDTFSRSGRRGH
jgi:hypothetical protein